MNHLLTIKSVFQRKVLDASLGFAAGVCFKILYNNMLYRILFLFVQSFKNLMINN